jgi:plasmid stabilization system protein ParE
MKPVIFHPEARAELTAAAQYYEAQREGLGLEFTEAIEAVIEQIRQLPGAGALDEQTGRRKRVMRRFPYLIVYQELEDAIWIGAVAHQRRRPRYWADREPDPPSSGNGKS